MISVVTGASSGIGRETARGLAARGHTVLLTGRNPERTEAVAEHIRAAGGEAHAFLVDFAKLDAVRGFAEALAPWPRIDVLIHNAGLWNATRRVTADGLEMTLAVNHLAPFLLTHLLMPKLQHGDEARIVHVSSRLHETAGRKRGFGWQIGHAIEVVGLRRRSSSPGLDLDDLQLEHGDYVGIDAYARSKLAQVLFSNELARRLAGTPITSNALHPGSVSTNVTRDSAFLGRAIKLGRLVGLKTPEQGAATSLYAATSPELRGVSGAWLVDSAVSTPSPNALDEGAARALWDASAELVGLTTTL